MKKALLIALSLSSLPVLAQSQSLSFFNSQFSPREWTNSDESFSIDKPKGWGLRYTRDCLKVGDTRVSFEASWLPKTAEQDILINGVDSLMLRYRYEYIGLGASITWTKVVDLGFCLDARHESNTTRLIMGSNTLDTSGSFTRPWATFRVGYTFETQGVKPFVALEYGLPLAKKTYDKVLSPYTTGGNLNPKSQLSIVTGIRF